ncbi:hypothetical protein GCM10009765_03380 [Fodinicola feengrottensis]|uniref:VUT family protein n=1 Tax=Fodinicola feengrottensis TaxID=435914 RepID=A0ABN2FRB3_9ACTN
MAANTLTARIGVLPVGFGLLAPAGVYAAGAAMALRNTVQHTLGARGAWAALAAGTVLSYLTANGHVATSSAIAFGASETVAIAFYGALAQCRVRGLLANVAGIAVDSVVFVWLAFATLAFVPGQLVGKACGLLIAPLLISCCRCLTPAAPVPAP